MSKLRLHGTSSGYTDIAPTAAAGNNTLTAPTGTGTIVAEDSSGNITISEGLVHTGDTDTKIKFPAADTITAETGGSERLRIDSSGNVGINESSPDRKLHVGGSFIRVDDGYGLDSSGSTEKVVLDNGFIALTTNSSERVRIASNGRVGIGTVIPQTTLDVYGEVTLPVNNTLRWVLGTTSMFDMYSNSGGTLIFRSSGSEKVRFGSDGNVGINNTSPAYKLDAAASGTVVSRFRQNTNDESATAACTIYRHAAATGGNTGFVVLFQNASGSTVGSIKSNTSATAFNTSSDYRLKENVIALSDAITRLKTLKPYRFNFKSNPSTTVDGFLAHEVTAVPEAIAGTKDEVDSDNNPVYQGIDQSKLVPLLTAALQEAVTKIETLETKVAALESA